MQVIEAAQAEIREFNDGAIRVNEFAFPESTLINDALITLTGHYPESGFAVNDVSTALISVESREGSVTTMDGDEVKLSTGDRVLIAPGEPYYFTVTSQLIIRYVATPAWTAEQARIVQ